VGGWTTGIAIGTTRSADISGTITAVARGPVQGGCLMGSTDASSSVIVLTVEATSDAGTSAWDIEYQVPTSGLVWTVGSHVLVTYSEGGGGWGPQTVALTISYGQAVDVYIGKSGAVEGLTNSPFTFRQGAAVCAQHETCGDWSGYDLEVQANGGWRPVPYGATTALGGYRIIHGGVRQQTSSNSACADWYVSSTRVAALRDGS
jgi:hypothetical protein